MSGIRTVKALRLMAAGLLCLAVSACGTGGRPSAGLHPETQKARPSSLSGGSLPTTSTPAVPSTTASQGQARWVPLGSFGGGSLANKLVVSCPSASFCGAAANSAVAVMVGRRWSITRLSGNSQTYVSCVSPGFCGAVEYDSALIYDNGSWTAPTTIDQRANKGFVGVSCVSSTFCEAVDSSGYIYTYDGQGWSAGEIANSDYSGGFDGISCGSSTFCMVWDNGASILLFNGTSWNAIQSPDGSMSIGSVDCFSPTSCVLVDRGLVEYQNGSWTSIPLPSNAGDLWSASCLSVTNCRVGGTNPLGPGGSVYTWSGTDWSAAHVSGASLGVQSISCPTESLCWAGDDTGDLFALAGQ